MRKCSNIKLMVFVTVSTLIPLYVSSKTVGLSPIRLLPILEDDPRSFKVISPSKCLIAWILGGLCIITLSFILLHRGRTS